MGPNPSDDEKTAGRPARRPRPVNAEWLFRAGAHYLERYASSAANLRRILERKVARRVGEWDEPPEAEAAALHREWIEATLARFAELKLIDDRSFAEARFASLRRRGASLRQAGAKLSEKGVDRETIEAVTAGDETGDRAAALRYARRRRLGPHRPRDRAERRDRDVAAMMRAGFSFADARRAIDGEGEEGGEEGDGGSAGF